MSIELKQAAQDAAEAIDWLLKNIRLDAPQLSGKAMGNAEKCTSALRAAIHQAEVQQPDTGEPVAWMASYVDPVGNDHVYVTSHRDLAVENDMHGEPKPLYDHPAPSVPGDDFDLICNAIDKADTITMEGDYMLDSDDCIAVVRVMQVLLSVRDAMIAAKDAT